MFTRVSIHSLGAAALALAAIAANSAPTQHDGRFYEVVIANGITWEAAKTAAEQRTFQGVRGRLATIGSPEEDMFVHQLRQQALGVSVLELWVGARQLPCATTAPEPGCGWLWINGQPISPVNSATPYTNWLPGEPNNLPSPTRASEDHLAIGLGGAIGWNDEGYLPHIRGYVVEYGDKVTIPATTCTADGPGCNPTGAEVLTFPATARVADDATLTARTFLFRDNSNRCGNVPMSLLNGAILLPPYLCGHPDFLVIQNDIAGVEMTSGNIEVEALTEIVLPGNLYGCDSVRQNPAGVIDPDPSHRDVVAWQTTDPARMLETTLGAGRFRGTPLEETYACGSSRGKVIGGSFHFVGLRIHPGPGNEFADNPQGNHQSFVELIRYKLVVLQASVVASKAALPGASFVALSAHIKNAIQSHDRGQYDSALQSIRRFLKEVEQAKYKPIANENPGGEHRMRASNVEFMYTEKLIPFAP
jgi:hypothetical protein